MCRQCKQLEKKIAQQRLSGDRPTSHWELSLFILETFRVASFALETKGNGGDVREDLDQASENLTKMYELDAPTCLIRKAHSVHGKRLRDFRDTLRENRTAVDPRRRRNQFVVIQGDKS